VQKDHLVCTPWHLSTYVFRPTRPGRKTYRSHVKSTGNRVLSEPLMQAACRFPGGVVEAAYL